MIWKDVGPQEQRCMEELKRRTLKDLTPALLEDESLFYRFSKARDYVIEDAEAMLKKHIAWRKQFKTDTILSDYKPSEVMRTYVPFHFVGYEKEGNPVLLVDYGNADIKGVFNSISKVDVCTYSVYTLEILTQKCKEQSKKLGKPISTCSFIFNFENFLFSNATNKKMLETLLGFIKLFQDNYPERIKEVNCINTPFYFNAVFTVVRHVLASVLLSKIHFYKPDDGWREALLDKIDAEVLPACFGGRRTDPDGNPRCITVIPPAPKVPESLYFVHSAKKLSGSKDARRLVVTRLSKETWSCEVTEPGSFLEWEFETKGKDIGFAVYYKPAEDCKWNELLPKQRVDTCYEPEKGFLRCDNPGTYICVFDNSYSWMYSKELYFRVQVTPPKEASA